MKITEAAAQSFGSLKEYRWDHMSMQSNMAYKYDLNKYRKLTSSENEEVKREKIVINKTKAEKTSTIKIGILAFAAAILLFFVIYGKVQVSDMYSKINDQKTILTNEENENKRLKAEIEANNSLKKVDEYAESIGLQKIDPSQFWYVELDNDDVVEINENKDNIFIKIKKLFSSAFEYFE